MRATLIARMSQILQQYGDPNRYTSRWQPVQERILVEILGVDFTGMKIKTIRQKVEAVDLNNLEMILFTANATDEQVIELFEYIVRRASVQM